MPEQRWTLRPAQDEDLDWLAPFYERVMRPYVELTHTWDENKFADSFSAKNRSIIQIGSRDIGMLMVEPREDYIYLGDLQIDEAFRGRGIGTAIIQQVIKQAKDARLPIRLRVLKGNPVIELYKRLDFAVVEELDNCYWMEKVDSRVKQ